MSGPENTFIASVHRHLPPIDQLYRMKNHNAFTGGIADVWYSGSKADLWIEYKFIAVPVRDRTVIDLVTRTPKEDSTIAALQQEWLIGRHNEGRQVGVLVGSKNGGVWFPGTSWDCTLTAAEFRAKILDRKALAHLIEGMVN